MYYTIIILILFSYFLGRKNGINREYDKININDINVIIDKLQNGKF